VVEKLTSFTLWISIFFIVVLILAIIFGSISTSRQQLVAKTKFDLDDTGLKDRAKLMAQYYAPRTAKLRMASMVFALVFVIGAVLTFAAAKSAEYPDPTWVYLAAIVMVVGAVITLVADCLVTYVQQQMTADYQKQVKDEGKKNDLKFMPADPKAVERSWMIRGAAYVALFGLVLVGLNLALSTVLI
jgi:fumarate reductase subunit C